jgi:hypothetical protein
MPEMPYSEVAVQLWVLTFGSRWSCVISCTNTLTTLSQGKQPQLPFVQQVPEPICLQSQREKPLSAKVGTLNLLSPCLSLSFYTDWTTQLMSWLVNDIKEENFTLKPGFLKNLKSNC